MPCKHWDTEKNIYTFTPGNDAKPPKQIGAWDFCIMVHCPYEIQTRSE